MEGIKIVRSDKTLAASFNKAVDSVARERLYLATVEGFPLEASVDYVAYMAENNFPQYFAVLDNEVVGWCDITPKDIPEFSHAGVLGMGVLPGFRGKGIGKRLLEETLTHAKEITCLERVELCVYKSNESAIELYKKTGFEIEGEEIRVRKIDGRYENEILMAKQIH